MYHRTVLAVTDFSAASANAAWRAALIATEHSAHLHLLHVVSSGKAPAPRGSRTPIDTQLENVRLHIMAVARRLRSELGADVSWRVVRGDPVRESVQASQNAHLLVIGSARRNALRESLMGTAAERLIRMARIPVLVVKRGAERAYRKLLVPVDLAQHAEAAVSAALDFSRGADVEVFHALRVRDDIGSPAPGAPEAVVLRHRKTAMNKARAALLAIIRAAGGTTRVRPALEFGHPPGTSLRQEVLMAPELVVIGKRDRSLLADFFLGSVTQRLLAEASSDLLILPVAVKASAAVVVARPSVPLQRSFWNWNSRISREG
jgi:nucleotide-binding universal stress UspA family protein